MLSKRILYAFALQLFFVSLLLANEGNAQRKTIEEVYVTVHKQSAELPEVFKLIESQTQFKFTYNSGKVNLDQKVDLNESNESLYQVLTKLVRQTGLSFIQINENIHVRPFDSGVGNRVSIQEGEDIIRGVVRDKQGMGIPGVTVIVEGTTRGTVTDVDGNFNIEASEGENLVFSFIGYKSQKVAVGNSSSISIVMEEDEKTLEEVVVIGYGELSKEDVTGSVSSIATKSIENLPVSTVDQKMVGQVAGVQITQGSGAPGAGTSVKIRGSGSLGAGNEPLYVVDGMPYSSGMNQTLNPLSFLDPNMIESITVLKDASSTAIYGSRGANGVIMITTKKGEYEQTHISFSAKGGVQVVPDKGRPELLNQREFAQFQRDRIDIAVAQTENRAATLDDYPLEYRNLDQLEGKGTDWYDLILQNAPIQDYSFSLTKGSKDSRISFSVGYFNQEGVVKYTGLERMSTKLGIETNLSDKVKLSASIQPTFISQQRANTNANRNDIIGISLWANPISTPYDENGNLKPYIVAPQSRFHSAWSFPNPLFLLKERTQNQQTFQNLGIAFLEWSILPNLRVKSSINTILEASKYTLFEPSSLGGPNRPPVAGTGRSVNTRSDSFNWLVENTLDYSKSFGDHSFNGLLGYTAQKFSSNGISLTASPYADDLIETINAAQAISDWSEGVNEWSMISYLGRLNYAFKERYLFTATFRSDGSSRFGSENRFAFFPSLAGAWRISEEAFFGDSKVLSDMKLRVSYGKSGNNNIGNYAHLAAISAGSYVFGTNQVTASSVGLPNPFLTWEESDQIDVGLDFGFFENRFSLVLDYYNRKSKNMLLNDVIPAITGFNSQTINQGNVRNRGVEIGLMGTVIQSSDFQWDVNANIAFNRNKIISLNDNTVRILAGNNDGNPTHVSVVGRPIGQFFGFVLEGVYSAEDIEQIGEVNSPQVYEGNVKYRDVNGDGSVNDVLDYTIIGNPHPDFIFGLTNNLSFKSLDLGVIINGQYGGQVMNGLRQTTDNLQGFFNVDHDWENRWRNRDEPGDGIHSGIPKVRPSWGHRVSTLWVEDASYLRISNLTLGYSFADELFNKGKFLKNARVYISIQNLAMFTQYKGANPEGQSVSTGNVLTPGFDMTSYPLARTTSIGINVGF